MARSPACRLHETRSDMSDVALGERAAHKKLMLPGHRLEGGHKA
tara:strand:- start:275 stop:406 length:132 start_codon:yes stop_codon:yes gene_type:complete